MTTPTDPARTVYIGNGTGTLFSTGFVFLEADTIKVTLVNDSTEIGVEQVLNTDYTMEGGGLPAAYGTVVMATAPAVGETLVIERVEPFEQGLDLISGDPFSAENIEANFDRLVMQIQQLLDITRRSVVQPITTNTSAPPATVPVPVPAQYLVGNAAGTGWESTSLDNVVAVGAISLPMSVANGGTAQTNAATILRSQYYLATGSGGAYAVTMVPAPPAYAEGDRITFRANHSCSVQPTLDYGHGALNLADADGVLLDDGDLLAGGIYTAIHNGTLLCLEGYRRFKITRLNDTKVYTANTTYIPAAGGDDLGIDVIEVYAVGGGGSGGGSNGSNETSGGGGGGGFAWARIPSNAVPSSNTVTIGAGGAAPTAGSNAGNAGGTTSVGTLLTAGGGGGGAASATSGDSVLGGAGGSGGTTGGIGTGDSIHIAGSPGECATRVDIGASNRIGSVAAGGKGAGTYGGGGGLPGIGANGAAGGNYGGGGGGCSGGVFSGGAGAGGVVIIKEYTVRYVAAQA